MITVQQTPAPRRQLNLATRHQLTAAGVPDGTITSRTRPGGPWQRLLPRVYLLQTGPPDHRQRALAAVLYAAETTADPLSGDTAALTGAAALALLGIRGAPYPHGAAHPPYPPADILIRAPRRLGGTPGVRPLRTSRWPRTITVSGIPSARPVRAAADFAARAQDPDRIRSTLAHVVQAGWCHPQDLHAELRAARLLTRPAVRAAAAELLAGTRSLAEARAREGLSATDLPTPLWNARLYTPDGAFLASPDAYWPDEGVALEIDSAEYHYTRDAPPATAGRYPQASHPPPPPAPGVPRHPRDQRHPVDDPRHPHGGRRGPPRPPRALVNPPHPTHSPGPRPPTTPTAVRLMSGSRQQEADVVVPPGVLERGRDVQNGLPVGAFAHAGEHGLRCLRKPCGAAGVDCVDELRGGKRPSGTPQEQSRVAAPAAGDEPGDGLQLGPPGTG
ncbi:hypothetical protein ACFCZ1_31555 [Streptomyces sp. NPDC056224]|uniref:hypothetical protein n=1 Tax=Streptomyces sp. NPDC056224 TaxID=3345750 RepID=UPI0035DBE93C